MTVLTPTIPRSPASRLRWGAADALVITQRGLAHWARNPVQVLAAMAFPILLVLLFGYIFGSQMQVEGGGNYREFLMPGLFTMAMAFGIGETMAGVSADASNGVTDRFRSMPMSAASVVIGRSLVDMMYSVVVLALLLGTGVAVGWRWRGGLTDGLLAIGLLLLLRFGLLWVGIFLGLVIKGAEAAVAVQTLLFPLGIVANTFASPEAMPGWLGAVASWNPLSSTAAATRDLFGNPGTGAESWIGTHAGLMAVVWPLIIVAIFLPLSVRRYQRLSR